MPIPPARWDGDETSLDLTWVEEVIEAFRAKDIESGDDKCPDNLYHADAAPLVEIYKRFMLGNWLALLDAFYFCKSEELPMPEWVAEGLVEFCLSAAKGTSLGQRGRGKSLLGQATEAVKWNFRSGMFCRIRYAQGVPEGDLRTIFTPREVLRAIRLGRLAGIGETTEDALVALEMGLRGTFAQASLATLRRDYRRYDEIDDTFDLVMPETVAAFGFSPMDEGEEVGTYGLQFLPLNEVRSEPDEGGEGGA